MNFPRTLSLLLTLSLVTVSAVAQEENPKTTSIVKKFAPPTGFSRVDVAPGTFGAFLRKLEIRNDRITVQSYKGAKLNSPSAGIVLLDVGKRNLQQCADSIIRLHAEWKWASNQTDSIAYHFTSGDRSAWSDWRTGERFKVSGAKVKRVRSGKKADTYENFKSYLFHTFRYAGTQSLRFDSDKVAIDDLQPGDFFVSPGSPGHAVIVLDVVKNKVGDRAMLIGQGYMPAQDFHVVTSSSGVWFKVPTDGSAVDTPSWEAFPIETLRRFK